MALIIPPSQAIKFLASGEEPFNDTDLCGCTTEEKWSYQFTDGDNICFQIGSDCTVSDELIANGSFENGTGTDFTGSNWTRSVENSENTNVRRGAFGQTNCGSDLAYWTNSAGTPNTASITQTISGGLEVNKFYKLVFQARATIGTVTTSNADILKVTVGGQVYYVTLGSTWVEYIIFVTFSDAPSNDDVVFEINTDNPTDVSEIYLDCVSMVEAEACCILQHINNGCFELGQQVDEDILATFDNWILDGAVTESLTGGLDGSRCVLITSAGDFIQQDNVFLEGRNIVKLWGRSPVAGTLIQLTTENGGVIIGNINLTTEWTQYTFDITTTDEDLKILLVSDEQAFIDCVEVFSIPEINIYITGVDEPILVDPSVITPYEDVINVCIPIDDYTFPECFQICIESCISNLFLNSNFELGSGNTFTSWTLTQPSRTNHLLWSKDYTQAVWNKNNTSVLGNTILAPDNTLTGDTLTENASNGLHEVYQAFTFSATTYTYSIYAKNNGRRYICLSLGGGLGTYFDLQTGTVLGSFGASVGSIYEENGWYRCAITFTTTAGSQDMRVFLSDTGSSLSYTGNGTSGVYLWESQLENGSYVTPVIPTTNLAVTTSLGEFLQDATGGLFGSRCLKMWVDTAGVTTQLTQSITQTDGVEYTIRFYARVDEIYGNDYLTGPAAATLIDSTAWKQYTQTYVAVGSGSIPISFEFTNDANYGFVYLDNVEIFATADIVQTCSENMQYSENLDPCYKELVWYDNKDEALGINYASGFKNRMRLKIQAQNPQYIKEEFTKTLNGSLSTINSIKVKKTLDLNFDSLPEFIWDILANMIGVSNIEYNGKNYTPVIETEVSPQPDKNTRLYSGVVTLGIEGEYIAESTFNCP